MLIKNRIKSSKKRKAEKISRNIKQYFYGKFKYEASFPFTLAQRTTVIKWIEKQAKNINAYFYNQNK